MHQQEVRLWEVEHPVLCIFLVLSNMSLYPLIHLLLLQPNRYILINSLKSYETICITPRTSEKLTLTSSTLTSYLLAVEKAVVIPPPS